MRFASAKKRNALSVNMTPMIDVVFQLLIFFMTCSQVSDVSREVLELPKLFGSEDQANSEIIVNVNEAGELIVLAQPYTVPEFVALCLEEANHAHGGAAENLAITIRVDRRATCRTPNELGEALVKLGVTQVRFGVQSGGN